MWLVHILEMTECHFGPTDRVRPLLTRTGNSGTLYFNHWLLALGFWLLAFSSWPLA